MAGKPGRSGRRPTPTNILRLRGTLRADRHGDRHLEPKPRSAAVKCPAWVTGRARRVWTALAPELRRMGLLTVVDIPMFGALCVEIGNYITLLNDPDAKTTDRLKVLHEAKDIGDMFGLNPAARTRLRVTPSDEPDLQALLDSVVRAEKERRA